MMYSNEKVDKFDDRAPEVLTAKEDCPTYQKIKEKIRTTTVDGKPVEKPRFTEEEAMRLASETPHMHYVTDVMESQSRDNVGRFAKPVMEPSRQLTKKALNDYKKGDPTALAEIIANGIRLSANVITGKDLTPGTSWKAEMKYFGKLVEMLDADPKLAQAAQNAGMKETDLNTIRGVGELLKLDQKGAEANLKLAQAAAEGKDLLPEEKKQAVKDVLMAKLAVETMAKENRDKPCPEYTEMINGPMYMKAYGMAESELKDYQKIQADARNGVPRPLPPPGKLYADTGTLLMDALKCQKKERPAAVILLNSPTYRKNLEDAAEHILQEDKLMQKNPDQLVQELKYGAANDKLKNGERAMAFMSKNGMLSENQRREMTKEINNPDKARELAEAFQAKESQLRKQEGPRKQGEPALEAQEMQEPEAPVI